MLLELLVKVWQRCVTDKYVVDRFREEHEQRNSAGNAHKEAWVSVDPGGPPSLDDIVSLVVHYSRQY